SWAGHPSGVIIAYGPKRPKERDHVGRRRRPEEAKLSTVMSGSQVNEIGLYRRPRGPCCDHDLSCIPLSGRYTNRLIASCSCVMDSNDTPLDPITAAALVARTIDDIDASTEEQRDALLSDLLCAAWGSVRAQNQ